MDKLGRGPRTVWTMVATSRSRLASELAAELDAAVLPRLAALGVRTFLGAIQADEKGMLAGDDLEADFAALVAVDGGDDAFGPAFASLFDGIFEGVVPRRAAPDGGDLRDFVFRGDTAHDFLPAAPFGEGAYYYEINRRQPQVDSDAYLAKLADHVRLRSLFVELGLEAYVVYSTRDWELVFLGFDSPYVAQAAFSAPKLREVAIAHAETFLEPVVRAAPLTATRFADGLRVTCTFEPKDAA